MVVALDELANENAGLKAANGHLHHQTNKLAAEVLRLRAERDAWEATANRHYSEAFTLRAEVERLRADAARKS